LIDTFYYLDKSSKRQHSFKNCQLLLDLKESKILKHVSTRWLSITKCLQRILDNWDALYDFFKKEEEKAKGFAQTEKAKKMRVLYQSPTNQLYCLFLVETLKAFDVVNTELQSDEPKVHVMQTRLLRLLRTLSDSFLKPAVVGRGVSQIDFSKLMPYEFKADRDIIIGEPATAFIADPKSHLRPEKVKQFYSEAKQFFKVSCAYLKSKLPIDSLPLGHATVADPKKREKAEFSSLRFFVDKFPAMLPEGSTMTDLQREFAAYQRTDVSSCMVDRTDITWGNIAKLEDEDGERLFQILPAVMCSVLTIPHSSAHCERIFSMVRKNKTDHRSSMHEDTLEAVLINKGRKGDVLQRHYSASDMADLKSAYAKSLQVYKQKK
jgi:hypothetical protein